MNDGGRPRTGPATGTALDDSTTVRRGPDVHPADVPPHEWLRVVDRLLIDQGTPGDTRAVPRSTALRGLLPWLAHYADHRTGRNVRPSVARLAALLAVDPRTVSRSLAEAVDRGLIVRTAGHNNHRPTTYALALPASLVPDTAGGYEGTAPELVQDIRQVGTGHSVPSYRTPHAPDQGPETRGETPAPAVDPTHGGRHPSGNPADVPCRGCARERGRGDRTDVPTPTPPRIDAAALEAQYRSVCECGALPGQPHAAGCEAA